MLLQLTTVGRQLLNAEPVGVNITRVDFGAAFGYALPENPAGLTGSTTYVSNSIYAPQIIDANTIRYTLYLTKTIPSFNFGELALWAGTDLIAVAVAPSSLTKVGPGAGSDGTEFRLDFFVDLAPNQKYAVAEVATSNSVNSFPRLSVPDLLTPPAKNENNAYVIYGLTSTDLPYIAIADPTGKWSFSTKTQVYLTGTVVSSNPLGMGVVMAGDEYSGDVNDLVLQFTSGKLRGYCRIVTSANLVDQALQWNTPLGVLPEAGDSFLVVGPAEITAGGGGASVPAIPSNKVVLGSGTGITYTNGFAYDPATGELMVGGSNGTNGQFLRSGGTGQPAVWANPPAPSPAPAPPSAPVGELVFGTGTGLGSSSEFVYNPTTGELSVEGSIGTAGQVLKSGGTGQPAVWGAPNPRPNNEILIGSGATTPPTSSANFAYDPATGELTVDGVVGADGEVLMSAGPGFPAVWTPLPAAGGANFQLQIGGLLGDNTLEHHYHRVNLATDDAEYLIRTTRSDLPVASALQPTVLVMSASNNSTELGNHAHEVEIAYDYQNQTFIVLFIQTVADHNHTDANGEVFSNVVGKVERTTHQYFTLTPEFTEFAGGGLKTNHVLKQFSAIPQAEHFDPTAYTPYTGTFTLLNAGVYELVADLKFLASGGPTLPAGFNVFRAQLVPVDGIRVLGSIDASGNILDTGSQAISFQTTTNYPVTADANVLTSQGYADLKARWVIHSPSDYECKFQLAVSAYSTTDSGAAYGWRILCDLNKIQTLTKVVYSVFIPFKNVGATTTLGTSSTDVNLTGGTSYGWFPGLHQVNSTFIDTGDGGVTKDQGLMLGALGTGVYVEPNVLASSGPWDTILEYPMPVSDYDVEWTVDIANVFTTGDTVTFSTYIAVQEPLAAAPLSGGMNGQNYAAAFFDFGNVGGPSFAFPAPGNTSLDGSYSGSLSLTTPGIHTVRMTVIGNTVRTYFDGELLAAINKLVNANPWSHPGYIGFRMQCAVNKAVVLKRITVKNLA